MSNLPSDEKIKEESGQKEVPFIGWAKFQEPEKERYGDLGVYLINPTDKTYDKVELLTGMFMSDDDEVIESNRVIKNLGVLNPHSFLKIDAMTWADLDFVIWYELDFYSDLNGKPELYKFQITKSYDWKEKNICSLPIININGIKIALEPRSGLTIQEEKAQNKNK